MWYYTTMNSISFLSLIILLGLMMLLVYLVFKNDTLAIEDIHHDVSEYIHANDN